MYDVPGATQQQLYERAKLFLLQDLVSDRSVLAYEDGKVLVAHGDIVRPCEGLWDCSTSPNNHVIFTMRVETKDEKIRATFSKVFHSTNPDNQMTTLSALGGNQHKRYDVIKAPFYSQAQWESHKKPLDALSVQLYEAVQTEAKKDDW